MWGATFKGIRKLDEPWFQFTHPVWGATLVTSSIPHDLDVSIHAPRVGCDLRQRVSTTAHRCVSIHAPRVGCDYKTLEEKKLIACFNSRTPCGVRLRPSSINTHTMMFQFTHPVWGATSSARSCFSRSRGFNSRTPCGVRPRKLYQYLHWSVFQFTHPVWGATAHTRRH